MRYLSVFFFFLFACQPQPQISASRDKDKVPGLCPIDYSNYIACYDENFTYFTYKYREDFKVMSSNGERVFKEMIGSSVAAYCARENLLREDLENLSNSEKDRCYDEIKIAGLDLLDELFRREGNQ